MDLPELQINDILRYLGENDNQESAPSLPHTYTKRATRDVCHTRSFRIGFDDGLPMMFNHNITGAEK